MRLGASHIKSALYMYVCVCIRFSVVVSLFLSVRKFLSETVFSQLSDSCIESPVTYRGERHLYNHFRLVFFEMHPYMLPVRILHYYFWPMCANLFFCEKKDQAAFNNILSQCMMICCFNVFFFLLFCRSLLIDSRCLKSLSFLLLFSLLCRSGAEECHW